MDKMNEYHGMGGSDNRDSLIQSIIPGFTREFEKLTLSREKQFSSVAATLPCNREKNRYNNVLPCKFILYLDHISQFGPGQNIFNDGDLI